MARATPAGQLDELHGVVDADQQVLGGLEAGAEQGALHQRTQHAGLGGEQRIDGRARDPGAPSDLGDGHLVDAPLGEQRLGRLEDAGPCCLSRIVALRGDIAAAGLRGHIGYSLL